MGVSTGFTHVFGPFLPAVKGIAFYPSPLPYFIPPLTPCNHGEIQLNRILWLLSA